MQTLYPTKHTIHNKIIHLPIIILNNISFNSIQQKLILHPKHKPIIKKNTNKIIKQKYNQHHHKNQNPHPLTILHKHKPLHLQNTKTIIHQSTQTFTNYTNTK